VLDLINTVNFRRGAAREDALRGVDDLAEWLSGAGWLDSRSRASLGQWARINVQDADALLRDVRRIRELAAHLIEAIIDRSRPSRRDLASLNTLARKCHKRRIDWTGSRYHYSLPSRSDLGNSIRDKCIESLVGLLLDGEVQKIARCQDERGCGWLFMDNSRLGNRKWCSMSDCGNLAKARAFLRRGRAVSGQTRN
jgi:predicted RNA-binding Zn ribbon-like protein